MARADFGVAKSLARALGGSRRLAESRVMGHAGPAVPGPQAKATATWRFTSGPALHEVPRNPGFGWERARDAMTRAAASANDVIAGEELADFLGRGLCAVRTVHRILAD